MYTTLTTLRIGVGRTRRFKIATSIELSHFNSYRYSVNAEDEDNVVSVSF